MENNFYSQYKDMEPSRRLSHLIHIFFVLTSATIVDIVTSSLLSVIEFVDDERRENGVPLNENGPAEF